MLRVLRVSGARVASPAKSALLGSSPPAGGAAGRHTHPGAETGYVLDGELELVIDGQPPKTIKAGESYQIPPGAIHDAKAGDKPFKVLGVYVAQAGEPLAKPAP
ncbi:quercetin dioxygenase-like cupin family protein [Bradyrhizobium sp. USDA 10063]